MSPRPIGPAAMSVATWDAMWGHDSGYSTTPASTAGILPRDAFSLAEIGQLTQSFTMTGVTAASTAAATISSAHGSSASKAIGPSITRKANHSAPGGPSAGFAPGGVPIPAPGSSDRRRRTGWSPPEADLATPSTSGCCTSQAAGPGRRSTAQSLPLRRAQVRMRPDHYRRPAVRYPALAGRSASGTNICSRITGDPGEYLYVKIPSYTTFNPGTGNGPLLTGAPTNLSHDLTNNIFRAGLAYKFGFYSTRSGRLQ